MIVQCLTKLTNKRINDLEPNKGHKVQNNPETTDHTSGLMSGWVMTFFGPLAATSQAAASSLWYMGMS